MCFQLFRKMSRKYKTLTDRHCKVLCHKCEIETTLELQHFSVTNDDDITEKITWACCVCKDSTSDYSAFTIVEWKTLLQNSLQLRNRLILRKNFPEIFPNGLEFYKNEPFHTLLQHGNIEISRNRIIEQEEKESCCICYSTFVKRDRTAVCIFFLTVLKNVLLGSWNLSWPIC